MNFTRLTVSLTLKISKPMRVDTMVVLKEYAELSKAEMAKTWLDEVGMWSMVNSEYMSTSTNAQLIVRNEDATRASEIITAHEEPQDEQGKETESEYIVY